MSDINWTNQIVWSNNNEPDIKALYKQVQNLERQIILLSELVLLKQVTPEDMEWAKTVLKRHEKGNYKCP